MYAKKICDLAQKSDEDFLQLVAEGMQLIISNARRLAAGRTPLADAGQYHPARVLAAVADEEAAKYMILLDAVRCPRKSEMFGKHLRRFNDHLAKAMYVRACEMRPTNMQDLQRSVDRLRRPFYLDGPNSVDWISRNELIEEREALLYVDYVRADDEKNYWSDPGRFENRGGCEPLALRLTEALFAVGISSFDALRAVADVWRPVAITADTHWDELRQLNWETLKELETRGLLQDEQEAILRRVVDQWPFPMYGLCMDKFAKQEEVAVVEHLRDHQRAWSAEMY